MSGYIVDLIDGRQVRFSYGVPVAAFIPKFYEWDGALHGDEADEWIEEHGIPRGYIKTDKRYSVTTSRHANEFARDGATVPDAVLRRLIEPLTGKR